MKVKAKDIARELGLSTATVSLALNNRPGVNADTRARVLKYMEESQGKDEELKKKEKILRMYSFRDDRQYWDPSEHVRLYSSYEEAARRAKLSGYKMELVIVYRGKDDMAELLRECEKDAIAGVFLSAAYMEKKEYDCFKGFKLPFIVSDNDFNDLRTDSIVLNNQQGVKMGLTYLYDNGHRDIVYFRNSNNFYNMYERREGYRRFMEEKGLPFDVEKNIVDIGGDTQSIFDRMVNYIKDKGHIPTAIFAENFEVTIGVSKALESCGYEIPKDVSVVGFDEIPGTALLNVRPVCIRALHAEVANLAAGRLIERVKMKKRESVNILVNNEMVAGNSVRNIMK